MWFRTYTRAFLPPTLPRRHGLCSGQRGNLPPYNPLLGQCVHTSRRHVADSHPPLRNRCHRRSEAGDTPLSSIRGRQRSAVRQNHAELSAQRGQSLPDIEIAAVFRCNPRLQFGQLACSQIPSAHHRAPEAPFVSDLQHPCIYSVRDLFGEIARTSGPV